MRRKIQSHEVLNPERVMSHMLRDYVEGALDDNRVLFRASVVAVDTSGGQLETDPPNPQNSIRARILDGYDANTPDDDLTIFWPLYSHLVQPIKEKEHVYVIFEDATRQNGLWITRVPEPLDVANTNYVQGIAKYLERPENELSNINVDQQVQGLTAPPTSVDVSAEFTVEPVIPFTPRVGDYVIYGSNNATIVIGRDRPSTVDSGQVQTAGTIDLVAGRQTANEMDSINDKARIYVSELTDIDVNFGTDSVGTNPLAAAGAVVIGDQVRIVARQGMKIVVQSGDVTIDGSTITIGNNATEAAVLGNILVQKISDLIAQIAAISVPTAVGPSGPPVNASLISAISAQLQSALSQTVKVKA